MDATKILSVALQMTAPDRYHGIQVILIDGWSSIMAYKMGNSESESYTDVQG